MRGSWVGLFEIFLERFSNGEDAMGAWMTPEI
jgi:hypothetical protein